MFKKFIQITLLTFLISTSPFLVSAQNSTQDNSSTTTTNTGINESDSDEKEFSETLDKLFPSETELFDEEKGNFAQGDLEQDILPRLLRLLVIISGTFITIVFTYVGFRLVVSRDDESELTNLKNTFTQVVIGTVLILSAFALVIGIIQYFDSLR
jgi:hypothetical protein